MKQHHATRPALSAREVGRRLRSLRQAHHKTLRDLAMSAGLSPATQSRLENGEINPGEIRWRTVAGLADYFQTSADYVMGREWMSASEWKDVSAWQEPSVMTDQSAWQTISFKGVSPRAGISDPRLHELVGLVAALPQEIRSRVIDFVRFELSRMSSGSQE